jgi:hypothetical protein
MSISDAQREMRSAFLGGFAGQLVTGILWAISAAVATWNTPEAGMVALFFGCMFIFPLTQVVLRLIGRPAAVSAGNSLGQLAKQIAFTVPINFLLVGAATLYRADWFYPAAMIVVGTHYLPFVFLYGMWQFGVLAALLIGGGVAIGLYLPGFFSLGGWLAAVAFIVFAFIGLQVVLREESRRRALANLPQA